MATKMKNEIEFSIDKMEIFENAITTALKCTDKEPAGCLIQFSNKGIQITSIHPEELSAFTGFIPKEILLSYKRKLDESKETRDRMHEIWFTKDNLLHLHKMIGIKGDNLYKINITDSRINMNCTTLKKSMVIMHEDPIIIASIKRIQGIIDKMIETTDLKFITPMENFAFGIAAIEKLLRKDGNYSHKGGSVYIKKNSIIISIILETDEIEVLLEGKETQIKEKTEIKEQINMVELSAATKNMKKICKTINIHAESNKPIILIGKTDTGVEIKYLLAPLVNNE